MPIFRLLIQSRILQISQLLRRILFIPTLENPASSGRKTRKNLLLYLSKEI